MTRRECFPASAPKRVDVQVPAGSVDVVGRASDELVVTLDGSGVDQWEISDVGDAVSVRPPGRWRTRSVRAVVEVPDGSSVEVRTMSASVVLSGRLGATRIHTASGDVRVAAVDEVDVRTASGDVRIAAVGADAETSTVSGDLEIGDAHGRLSAVTASGDVVVGRLRGDAEIGTASGDVRIGRFDGDQADIKVVSGDVQIGLPSGIRVEPDIVTLSGRTHLPGPAPAGTPTPTGPRRTVRLRIKTASGDVRIDRADEG